MTVYALIFCTNEEIYLYSTKEKAEGALIQRMADAVKKDEDLDFSSWEIVPCCLDGGEDLLY